MSTFFCKIKYQLKVTTLFYVWSTHLYKTLIWYFVEHIAAYNIFKRPLKPCLFQDSYSNRVERNFLTKHLIQILYIENRLRIINKCTRTLLSIWIQKCKKKIKNKEVHSFKWITWKGTKCWLYYFDYLLTFRTNHHVSIVNECCSSL